MAGSSQIASPETMGVGTIEGIYGGYEYFKNKQKEEDLINNQPNYNIPAEVQQALNISRAQAQGNMPGFNTSQNQLSGQSASSMSNISKLGLDPTMSIGALSRITSEEMKARADLEVKNAIFKSHSNQSWQNQLQNMANEKEKQWNWNVAGKWENQLGLAEANKQEGAQMLSQGINNVTGASLNMSSMNKNTFNQPSAGGRPQEQSGGLGDTGQSGGNMDMMQSLPLTLGA